MPSLCEYCNDRKARIMRPKNRKRICLECFFEVFENEIHLTVTENQVFTRGKDLRAIFAQI